MASKASSRKTVTGENRTAARKRSGKTAVESAKRKAIEAAAKRLAAKSGPEPAKRAAAKTARKSAGKATEKAAAETSASPARKQKPPKSPLRKAQLMKFRQMLLEKRRELVGDMTGIEAEALGADRQEVKGDISDHPADAGTDNFEQEFSLGLLESERVLLAEIDEALRRIEDRTYGICLGTGKPIGTPRLRARPWAKYGIEYARMVEKGLVRPGERLEEDDE
ncbi:MAG: TraR/DksA C4-type zinc finger protein [Phycisphaerae bacterium]